MIDQLRIKIICNNPFIIEQIKPYVNSTNEGLQILIYNVNSEWISPSL